MMAEDWSKIEDELIVADYFAMLKDELAGRPYVKSEHRRQLIPLLNNRSEGSIEFKYQNISAVLAKFGIPWIVGYKPRWNYQRAVLEDIVVNHLKQNLSVENDFREFAESTQKKIDQNQLEFASMVEEPPAKSEVSESEEFYGSRPFQVNYLEIEQANKTLGTFGEEIVLEYEKWRLIDAGRESLSEKIEWVANTQGDWIGYDILSRNTNGTDRFIEVKTTKLGKDAPIFFSRNEYDFSKKNAQRYFLYRVFNFNKQPRLFIVNGKFDDFCRYDPIKFKGYL